MVGRLVEQDQIGLLRQRAGDGGAAFLAAAGGGGRAGHVDTELAGDGLHLVGGGSVIAARRKVHKHLVGGGSVIAARREVHKGGERREIRVLFKEHDLRARLHPALSAIRLDAACDNAQQRGLARAIAPDGPPNSQRPPCCNAMPSSEKMGGCAMTRAT